MLWLEQRRQKRHAKNEEVLKQKIRQNERLERYAESVVSAIRARRRLRIPCDYLNKGNLLPDYLQGSSGDRRARVQDRQRVADLICVKLKPEFNGVTVRIIDQYDIIVPGRGGWYPKYPYKGCFYEMRVTLSRGQRLK